eukprot:95788-Pyramimonas_sp.AAC.1
MGANHALQGEVKHLKLNFEAEAEAKAELAGEVELLQSGLSAAEEKVRARAQAEAAGERSEREPLASGEHQARPGGRPARGQAGADERGGANADAGGGPGGKRGGEQAAVEELEQDDQGPERGAAAHEGDARQERRGQEAHGRRGGVGKSDRLAGLLSPRARALT